MIKTVVVLVVFLGIAGACSLWFYNRAITTPSQQASQEETPFVIEKGDVVSTIGARLEEGGFISSATIFRLYAKLNPHKAQSIQAGAYSIPPNQSIVTLFELFQNGSFVMRLRLIEGWRREQMAEYVANELGQAFGEQFLAATKEDEGRLFPDTYIVEKTITPQELRDMLVTTFEQKLTLDRREQLRQQGITQQQLLILASIVEREVVTMDDRKIVAGILLKRWRNNWMLGADATTQYAVATTQCVLFTQCAWWPKSLTFEDLSLDSPFNTRRVTGLPPGPIANPGLGAIDAVLGYVESPYWYYLSDAEGNTHFAETLEQHNLNIASYINT